jgi:hypothetical protein
MSTVSNCAPAPPAPAGASSRRVLWGTLVLTVLVAAVWVFPRLWYTATAAGEKPLWFGVRTNLAGWTWREIPLDESAERLLVADVATFGEFQNPATRQVVRAFSAKRYTFKPHDTGLFLHTPDRCWTLAGWKFEPVTPDHIERVVHGVRLVFERRVFVAGGERELVYFGGLVGGQPLPYRLDHNLSVGLRFATTPPEKSQSRGFFARAVDARLWERVWDGFRSRRPLLGPKQFIRISTPLRGADLAAADRLLSEFLEQWLEPVDYAAELAAWQARKS